jgi:tetratricopeptide (TPR) repeat protein
MSATISIREKSCEGEYFDLVVSFGNNINCFQVKLKNPYDKNTEKEFEWYFEEYIREPYTPELTIEKYPKTIALYGENLFKSIFSRDSEIHSKYKNIIQNNSHEDITIQIVGDSAAFYGIHWESLKDPDLNEPFVACGTILYRKNSVMIPIETRIEPSPYINQLIVTAQPDEEDDVNYRTIQRPLINVIKNAKLKVKPHILRPGTYRSFTEHLKKTPKGFYHIIHFDLHGSLFDYRGLKEEALIGRVDIHSRDGLGAIQPYEGKRNFIFFESDEKGLAIPVDACEIASLLKTKQIPVCMFNACQSAKQESLDRDTGFGRQLVKEGVQMAIAMCYSISITAAEIMMEKIYSSIFNNDSIEASVAAGRRELYLKRERNAWLGHVIKLEDWLLPIIYKNKDIDFNLIPFTEDEKINFYKEEENRIRYHLPQYGFHGRDLDILKIEKRLLIHNQLLIQGMVGSGKTTLLDYLRWWWQETSFVENSFYFPYDRKAWTTEQIVYEIAQKLLPEEDFKNFSSKPIREQEKEILYLFNSKRYAIILDNTESITGEKSTIANILPEIEKQSLKDFLSKIKKESFVILGSKSDEKWLKSNTFKDNVYVLRGFTKATSSTFAKKILNSVGLNFDEIIQDFNFSRLLDLLSGNPFAMQALLSNLKCKSPTEILQSLKTGNADLDIKNEQVKDQSLLKCIEYAYNNISEDSRRLLICLAPFQSTVNLKFIDIYYGELGKKEFLKGICLDKIENIFHEAAKNGLMCQTSNATPFSMDLHPAFSYFLKNKLNEEHGKSFSKSFENAFTKYFNDFCIFLGKSLLVSKEVKEYQLGLLLIEFEYENLLTAVDICIKRGETAMYPYYALTQFLQYKRKYQDILDLSNRILERFEGAQIEKLKGDLLKEYIGTIDMVGNVYSKINDLGKAEKYFLKELALFGNDGVKELLSSNDGNVYLNLGAVFDGSKDWTKYEEYLKKALKIFRQQKNKYGQAKVYQNFGVLYLDLERYKDSQDYFIKALEIYKELGDKKYQAQIYNNLGEVARRSKNFEKVKYYLEKALKIRIRQNDIYGQGNTYLNMAKSMLDSDRPQESTDFFKKALEIFIVLKDEHKQFQIYMDMGRVELAQFQTFKKLGKIEIALEKIKESMGYFQKSIMIGAQSNNEKMKEIAEKEAKIVLEYSLKFSHELLKFSTEAFGEFTEKISKKLSENPLK